MLEGSGIADPVIMVFSEVVEEESDLIRLLSYAISAKAEWSIAISKPPEMEIVI